MTHVALSYVATHPRSSHALDARRLQRVLEFVEGHLETDISVGDLASVACLSQFHFCRAFRRATGKTPHHFVNARRIDKAKELLIKGGVTLAEVALVCNFSSQASFTRAFSRVVGIPPGEYRRLADQTNGRGRHTARSVKSRARMGKTTAVQG